MPTAASLRLSLTNPAMALSVLNMKCGSICCRNAPSRALESCSLSRAVSVSWRAIRSLESTTIVSAAMKPYTITDESRP